MSFTSVGTAAPHIDNGKYINSLNIFTGVVFGGSNSTDQNTPGTPLVNCNVLTFTFSQPVTGGFTLGDLDNSNGWLDAIGFEAWAGTAGAIGTGVQPNSVATGTKVVTVANGYTNLPTTYQGNGSGNSNFAEANSLVTFWNTPFQTVKFYSFDANLAVETSNHGIGILSAGNPVPLEPGVNDNLKVPEPSVIAILGCFTFLGCFGFRQRK